MPKVELDVVLLTVSQDLIAEAGDRLIVFNGTVLDVLPKGAKLDEGIATKEAASKHRPVEFDPEKVQALLNSDIVHCSTFDLNKRLHYTGTPAARLCSAWLRYQVVKGDLHRSSGRYPKFWLPDRTKP